MVEGAPLEEVKEMRLEPRGAWLRLLALAIDGVVLFIIALILSAIFGTETRIASYLLLAIIFIYFVGFWTWRGQTPSKMVIGAKIIKTDDSSIGWGRAFLRFIGYFGYFLVAMYTPLLVSIVILFLAFIIIAFSSEKRGLHDLLVSTRVVGNR